MIATIPNRSASQSVGLASRRCMAGAVVLAIALTTTLANRAAAQEGCNGYEEISARCGLSGDVVKKTVVKLKKAQPRTEYVCVLKGDRERAATTNGNGKTKFKFKYPRNERPACGTDGQAIVGIDDGEFQECVVEDFVCACDDDCPVIDVSGFEVQSIVNHTYQRAGDLLWSSGTHNILWNPDTVLWEIRKTAGEGAARPAICAMPNNQPGEGPSECTAWREWTGSQRGFVAVDGRFDCRR